MSSSPSSNRRSRVGLFLGALASTLLITGIAGASVPSTSTVIHGCYGKRDGQLRIIDVRRQSCNPRFETPISWNQTGPQGPPGPPGPPGPAGPAGDAGTTSLAFGYVQDGTCGTDPVPGVPSSDPCPFRVLAAPESVTVTPVLGADSDQVYGYCVAGLKRAPASVIGSIGIQQQAPADTFGDMLVDVTGESLQIQRPPEFCPAGSQFIVRSGRDDDQGGALCSPRSEVCASLVYRLVLG